jgi:hypothetical protein
MPLNMASHRTLHIYIYSAYSAIPDLTLNKCFKRLKNVILCLNGNFKNHWDLALRHLMKISRRGN